MSAAARAQTTSLEFFIVSGVVVLTVTMSYVLYDTSAKRTGDAHDRIAMETIALHIVDVLVKTNGMPGDWDANPSTVTSFGLAKDTQRLDRQKINSFVAFNYNSARNIMGIENYNYSFAVRALNKSVINKSGVPPSNARVAVNPRLPAVLDKNVVYVDFILWR